MQDTVEDGRNSGRSIEGQRQIDSNNLPRCHPPKAQVKVIRAFQSSVSAFPHH
jgi:hypothetical protein